MRVLLDENVDIGLRREFVGLEVQTVVKMGWSSVKHGELLRLASENFDVHLTCDRQMQYQQNISAFDVAIVLLRAKRNDLKHLRPLMPQVLTVLRSPLAPGTVTVIADPTAPTSV